MFNSLITQPLERLLNRQVSEPGRSAAPERGVMSVTGVMSTQFAMTQPGDMLSPQVSHSTARAPRLAARRPLAAVGGALAGFEFCVDSPQRARVRFDNATARECAHSVLRAMQPCAAAGQVALAELPASWLTLCLSEGNFQRGMYLVLAAEAIPEDAATLASLIDTLRSRGVMMGWRVPMSSTAPTPPGRPDFVPVTAMARSAVDSWQHAVAEAGRRWPGVPQVLLDMPSVELLDSLLVAPVALAACTAGVCDEPAQIEALSPAAGRLLHLLGVIEGDATGKRMATMLKNDSSLTQFLLKGLNSSSGGAGRGFLSIERALVVLGREGLHRHVARLLVHESPMRAATVTLRQHALVRARLTELLAIQAGEADSVALYLTGLASMLPTLLRCSVDDALAPMLLPAEAITALAEQAGPWMHYVTLIRALERHDMVAVEGLAMPFGGLQAVLSMHDEAWRAPV